MQTSKPQRNHVHLGALPPRSLQTIGMPRGLLYWQYGPLWRAFFEELGLEVVESAPTDRAIYEAGDALSIDECCMASKVYMGHVADLLGKCDAIFIPCYDSCNVREGFCTKYQSLPDMVRNTLRGYDTGMLQLPFSAEGERETEILSLHVSAANDEKRTRGEFIEFAIRRLGASPRQAAKAWRAARKALVKHQREAASYQAKTLKLLKELTGVLSKDPSEIMQRPLVILLVAHPYIAHDGFIAGDIVRALEQAGVVVLFADEYDPQAAIAASYKFSETLPWLINRQLAGATMQLLPNIDGVVLVSAFPCGPDSMFDEALMRAIAAHGAAKGSSGAKVARTAQQATKATKPARTDQSTQGAQLTPLTQDMQSVRDAQGRQVPVLNLMLDAQSGSAGVQTRIESFLDILRYRGKNGYLG